MANVMANAKAVIKFKASFKCQNTAADHLEKQFEC